jgi:hypothetical protein
MATFYNQFVRNINDSVVIALTSSSDSTIVLSILATNTDGANAADITLEQQDDSSVLESYLAYTIPVPADSNLDLISNKYILPSGKKLGVLASASGKLDLIISYVEV